MKLFGKLEEHAVIYIEAGDRLQVGEIEAEAYDLPEKCVLVTLSGGIDSVEICASEHYMRRFAEQILLRLQELAEAR